MMTPWRRKSISIPWLKLKGTVDNGYISLISDIIEVGCTNFPSSLRVSLVLFSCETLKSWSGKEEEGRHFSPANKTGCVEDAWDGSGNRRTGNQPTGGNRHYNRIKVDWVTILSLFGRLATLAERGDLRFAPCALRPPPPPGHREESADKQFVAEPKARPVVKSCTPGSSFIEDVLLLLLCLGKGHGHGLI